MEGVTARPLEAVDVVRVAVADGRQLARVCDREGHWHDGIGYEPPVSVEHLDGPLGAARGLAHRPGRDVTQPQHLRPARPAR